MNVGDRFPVALDVEVTQLNNDRARLEFKTDNATIVRFWYGVDSLPIAYMCRKHETDALLRTR